MILATQNRPWKWGRTRFVWDPLTEKWEEGFSALKKFKEREGHCRVPWHLTEDRYTLGQWVSRQRKKQAELTEDHRSRLNALGFVWDAREPASG